MNSHIISMLDFDRFKTKTRIAGQHTEGISKSIDMLVSPYQKRIWFVVENQKNMIAEVPTLKEAIELYNKI